MKTLNLAMVVILAMFMTSCGAVAAQQLVCPAYVCPIPKCPDNPMPNGTVIYSPNGRYTFALSIDDDFLVCVQGKGSNGATFTGNCITLGVLREVVLSYRAEEGKR